jgi:pimeloyl-ACP methyl ester carboxylesterase
MNHLLKKLAASTLALGAVAFSAASHAAPAQDLKGANVVLVHGAFADGSSWNRVIPLLEARGAHVTAVQNPLSSLADDVAATKRVIDAQPGPVVLVGHSWAGVVITQAGNDPKVKSLVYVAAFAPDQDQSVNDILKDKPAPSWASKLIKDSGGYLTLPTDVVVHDFAQDVPAAQAKVIAATQGPWFSGALGDKITTPAWKTKPSWTVITDKDHMIDPRLQQAMADHIGAKVTHVNASHVVMVSQPAAVANTIAAAAKAVK